MTSQVLPSAPIGTPRIWTVTALVRSVADALAARFDPVRVAGEVSGFVRAGSGHCYFTLKDEGGQLRCVLFRQQAQRADFLPRDGDQVELRGSLTVYAARGSLQLVVESLVRAGQGALLEQFLRLKARLEAQGLFASERKRALPEWPRGIGVVTSSDAAALRDVASTLHRRAPHVPVFLAPASVQGASAPAQMIAALQRLYRMATRAGEGPAVDVLLLVRGGGALEDLWAFNDESLARVIAESPVPLVSGVGHETDFTIADFVADVRAATPTAAAELAAPSRVEMVRKLDAAYRTLAQRVRRGVRDTAQRLDGLADRLWQPSTRLAAEKLRWARAHARFVAAVLRWAPGERTRLAGFELRLRLGIDQEAAVERQALTALSERWIAAWRRTLDARCGRLQKCALRLDLLDPHRPLTRGYAWLEDASGHPVVRASAAAPGSALRAVLLDGNLDTIVIDRHVQGVQPG